MQGPIFSLSLVSDFISIGIAIERMIGVCFPTKYKKINNHKFARASILASLIWGFIGRIFCSFINELFPRIDPVTNETRYTYGWSAFCDTTVYYYWQMLADVILPFVIMAAMCTLTGITYNAIIRRYLKKKKNKVVPLTQNMNQNPQIDQQADQMRTATQLLVVSTGMCFVSQLGQIGYTIAWEVFANMEVNFNSTPVEVEAYVDGRRTYNKVYIFQGFTENLARVMHFFMYIMISNTFRKEFLHSVRKIKSSITSSS